MAHKYDHKQAQRNREERNKDRGLNRLLCNTPGRFKVKRGNTVYNALSMGQRIR